jgi:hypothetical protein
LITKDLVKQVRVPAYIVTAYMALGSIFDVLATTWPIQLHDMRWRLTFEGLATGASGTELLAVLLFLVFAWAAVDHIALAIGFAYALVAGVAYLCGAAMFSLDVLQARGQIDPAQLSRYHMGAGWTIGRMIFAGVMLLFLAVVAFRAFRSLTRAERSVAGPAGNLVVGKPAAVPNRAPNRVTV